MSITPNQFVSWQNPSLKPGPPYGTCSPNLVKLREHGETEWGMQFLGCYTVRPINGGTSWSSHAYGAALDLGYRNGPNRDDVEVIMTFLIFNQADLGIQAVHDYWRGRYWRAGSTGWTNRPPGPKNDHIHVEVHPDAWNWTTTITERIKGTTPQVPPAPKPYPGRPIRRGSKQTANVKLIQTRLNELGFNSGPVDGKFGPVTEGAVRAFQAKHARPVDGLVGPVTWSALFA